MKLQKIRRSTSIPCAFLVPFNIKSNATIDSHNNKKEQRIGKQNQKELCNKDYGSRTKLLQLIHLRFAGSFSRPRIIFSFFSSSFIRLAIALQILPTKTEILTSELLRSSTKTSKFNRFTTQHTKNEKNIIDLKTNNQPNGINSLKSTDLIRLQIGVKTQRFNRKQPDLLEAMENREGNTQDLQKPRV